MPRRREGTSIQCRIDISELETKWLEHLTDYLSYAENEPQDPDNRLSVSAEMKELGDALRNKLGIATIMLDWRLERRVNMPDGQRVHITFEDSGFEHKGHTQGRVIAEVLRALLAKWRRDKADRFTVRWSVQSSWREPCAGVIAVSKNDIVELDLDDLDRAAGQALDTIDIAAAQKADAEAREHFSKKASG